jgi:hypothetical protein
VLNFFGNREDRKKLSPAEKDDITIHSAGNKINTIEIQITILLSHRDRISEVDIFALG